MAFWLQFRLQCCIVDMIDSRSNCEGVSAGTRAPRKAGFIVWHQDKMYDLSVKIC